MKKLLPMLVAASFAAVSATAFAAAHGGVPKDVDMKKMEEKMEACKKMDAKADDKMKAECKKMMDDKKASMEKKADAPKK